MKTETVKGFRDYEGEDALKREEIRKTLVGTFEKYGFTPAETPVVESESLVKGENSNDEAVSDIFKLKDKGKRKLALRYEFTFQLKRLIQNKKLPYKRYQIGPVFRDEPVSANRFRQFTQCDIDCVGSSVKDEAEVLAATVEALNKLKIKPTILVNNRALLNEILEDNDVSKKNKEQALRELDKFDKLGEREVRKKLKGLGAENVLDSIKKGEKYFSQFESYRDLISLMEYCKLYGFRILFSPTVVRGLSYYNGNVFEVKAQGIKDSIMGGGSYKINGIQSTGISFGLERISSIVKMELGQESYLVVSLEEDKVSIKIAQNLRKKGKRVNVYYGKPSKALEYANSKNISKVIFVGSKEVKSKKFKVKDMRSGKESLLKS